MTRRVPDSLGGKPHSLDQISSERLNWWRKRQLEYILAAEGVQCPSSALDVGVGEGHWSHLLFSIFEERRIEITGVDQEKHWIDASKQYLANNLARHRYTPLLGHAYDLRVPAESFDVVTCQTLLMHLDRPGDALREMCRALKPGGVLLVSEPLNQINMALTSLLLFIDKPALGNSIWRFWLLYHSTLKKMGYGDHNIASYLPSLIDQTKEFERVSAYHSDVVELSRSNASSIDGILNYLQSDGKSQEAIERLGRKEFERVREVLFELKGEPGIDDALIAWPQQNILFVGRKLAR